MLTVWKAAKACDSASTFHFTVRHESIKPQTQVVFLIDYEEHVWEDRRRKWCHHCRQTVQRSGRSRQLHQSAHCCLLLDLSSSCLLVQAFSWSSIHSVSFSKLDKQLLFCCHDNKNSPTVTLSGCWAVLCPELFHTEKYLLHHLSDIFLTHWIKIFLILIFKMHKKEIALDEALYLCGWAL